MADDVLPPPSTVGDSEEEDVEEERTNYRLPENGEKAADRKEKEEERVDADAPDEPAPDYTPDSSLARSGSYDLASGEEVSSAGAKSYEFEPIDKPRQWRESAAYVDPKTLLSVDAVTGTAREDERKAWHSERDVLEAEVQQLERQLRMEKDERRRLQTERADELEREVNEASERWMAVARVASDERDKLRSRMLQMEEQLETSRVELNRAVAYRMEMEESRNRLQNQYENLLKDYDETMQERSIVLEENTRLSDERDKLRQSVRHLSASLNSDAQRELEKTRRQLYLNMEETATMTDSLQEAMTETRHLREHCQRVEEDRDAARRELVEATAEREAIVDSWSTQTVEISLPFPKRTLGVVLAGGRQPDAAFHTPIYVSHIHHDSPLNGMLRCMDHIVVVNDIDVSGMDQRAVNDILRNSCHLKLVIRRRTALNRVTEMTIAASDVSDVELCNGVFVNNVQPGSAFHRAGLRPGHRLLYVSHQPVFDARQAERLIVESEHPVTLGVLTGLKSSAPPREEPPPTPKQKHSLLSKLFGNKNHPGDKPRSQVIAKANIDSASDSFYRVGSLRIPGQHVVQQQQLIRTGSLRTPAASSHAEHRQMLEQLDEYLHRQDNSAPTRNRRASTMVDALSGGSWSTQPTQPHSPAPAMPPRRRVRPSVQTVFADREHNHRPNSRSCACASPSPLTYQPAGRQVTSPSGGSQYSQSHSHHHHNGREANRVATISIPQPPPYPGPRTEAGDSLSSVMSSSLSVPQSREPHPSTSSVIISAVGNNSPCGTLLSDGGAECVRRVCLSKDANEFGLGLEDSGSGGGGVIISDVRGRASGLVQRGDRLLDVGGINMRSADKLSAARVLSHIGASQDEVTVLVSGKGVARHVHVPRSSVVLCGGNAIGILAEQTVGELMAGDRILEIDRISVRSATLEEAYAALDAAGVDHVDMFAEPGFEKLDRFRAGADGDGFYARVNIDRPAENEDDLDVKAGEIIYVDNTWFGGRRGRWRAWRVDSEGRQRQCGLLPSPRALKQQINRKKKRLSLPLCLGDPFTRVTRVAVAARRPVVVIGPVTQPFVRALLDEDASSKFVAVVPECRAFSSPTELERLFQEGQLIEAKRRERVYDVVAASAVREAMLDGLHCILDISPSGIRRLHSQKIYPIVIRLRFKSTKQVKEIKEDNSLEKFSTKQAKELIDQATIMEAELEGIECASLTVTGASGRGLARQVASQMVQLIDAEQAKPVWCTE